MIIHRLIAAVKPECQQQVIGLFQEVRAALPDPKAMRIYTSHPAGAPGYQVGWDIEFENLTALDQWLQQQTANPQSGDWFRRYEPLLQPGTGTSIWGLVE
jgi:hypothetical protein